MKAKRISGLAVLTLAIALSIGLQTQAQHVERPNYDNSIVVRRTIPYPNAVKRTPLTSDRLSTTSTRLIDARRGFRPYSSVHRKCGVPHYRQRVRMHYDDFGITRESYQRRPASRYTPRSTVTEYSNSSTTGSKTAAAKPVKYVIIQQPLATPAQPADQAADQADDEPRPDMTVRVHKNKPELPKRSGAVLILSDGTVIQVGD